MHSPGTMIAPVLVVTWKNITACQLVACVLLANGAAPASAQPPERRSISYELRAQLFSASYRWSNELYEVGQRERYPADAAEQSLYFTPGLGLRVFSSRQHGLLVDGEYRFDFDVDGWFSVEEDYRIRFGVAHVGFAYRHVIHPRRRPDRRAWAVTPHVSAAAGRARNLDLWHDFIPEKSPVVGVRVGIDLDFHVKRFFMGWSLGYEYLRHTKGELRYSHFLSWNAIPFLRIGVDLGAPVQRQSSPLD